MEKVHGKLLVGVETDHRFHTALIIRYYALRFETIRSLLRFDGQGTLLLKPLQRFPPVAVQGPSFHGGKKWIFLRYSMDRSFLLKSRYGGFRLTFNARQSASLFRDFVKEIDCQIESAREINRYE